MLSYQHAFHAGNHADVLKHVTLIELLRYLAAKPKDLWYIDTHAGAGTYELGQSDVAVTEARTGVERLWNATDAPPMVLNYLQQLARLNPSGRLEHYPGSPRLAADTLRPGDRLWLSELHPAEHARLVATFGDRDRRIRIERRDGLAWLKALLPPAPKRALVMIDPSYEVASDYRSVAAALTDARRRFSTGVYAIWYPILRLRSAREFPRVLETAAGPKWLHARLMVRAPAEGGLYGSGLFIVNPPYVLAESLETTLSWLAQRLAQDSHRSYSIESRSR